MEKTKLTTLIAIAATCALSANASSIENFDESKAFNSAPDAIKSGWHWNSASKGPDDTGDDTGGGPTEDDSNN